MLTLNTNHTKKRYRILYLITQGILGGAQTHICHLALHLSSEYDVHVAIGVRGPLEEQLKEAGVPVYHVSSLVRPIAPYQDMRGLIQIIRLIRQIQPDLISTHSSKAGILGRLAAHCCGVPALFTAHGWAFTEGVPSTKRNMYILAERVAARWASKIICVSEYDRQLALRHGIGYENQLTTVHNGMPVVPQQYMASPGEGNPVRLIMVARFSEPKEHGLLLKAISGLRTQTPYKVYFVGDGPLLQQSEQLAAKLGVDDKVVFLGARRDVPALLAKAQVFVLISRWEGFPRSILEAMRAGLPVIASDVGGVSEAVVDGETGFLVPRGDIHTLAARLTRIVDDGRLRKQMGDKGRERFLANFTFDRMVEQTLEVYNRVLSSRT